MVACICMYMVRTVCGCGCGGRGEHANVWHASVEPAQHAHAGAGMPPPFLLLLAAEGAPAVDEPSFHLDPPLTIAQLTSKGMDAALRVSTTALPNHNVLMYDRAGG